MPTTKMRLLTTGIPGLDTILGGGIPAGSLIMLVGAPGTGKTMLIQQLCFTWAARQKAESQATAGGNGENSPEPGTAAPGARKKTGGVRPHINKAIYFSTLSEPHDKLLEHISQCDFFDDELLVEHLRLLSLTSVMDEGLDKIGDLIVDTARHEKAGLICIDGFRALEGLTTSADTIRRFLYRLSAQLSLLGVTTIVSLERLLQNDASEGDLTIADGIIGLFMRNVGARELSRVEIRKMRGMARLAGLHTYTITQAGITIYPRPEAMAPAELTYVPGTSGENRAGFGLPVLDEMLRGGLPHGSATMIAGSPGTGKSLLGLHFLAEGLRQGENALFLGFKSSYEQVLNKAANFGLDLRSAISTGKCRMFNIAPVEIEPDLVAQRLRNEVEKYGIQRLVIDNGLELERACVVENRSRDYMAALYTYLKDHGVTTVSILDIGKAAARLDLDLESTALASMAENLLLLRQVALNEQYSRVITILQMRDSEHERKSREFFIKRNTGFEIGQFVNDVIGM